jgi:hypothetical protein
MVAELHNLPLPPLLAEISWSKICVVTEKCKDPLEREFYIKMTKRYHRRLRCLIAIELKIGEFIPEYAGKMQFYLTALDEKMKLPDENPSIGIIICKSKKRTRVEYTLKTSNKPIGVATYSYYDNLPEEMRALLPSPDKIAAIIRGIGEKDDKLP